MLIALAFCRQVSSSSCPCHHDPSGALPFSCFACIALPVLLSLPGLSLSLLIFSLFFLLPVYLALQALVLSCSAWRFSICLVFLPESARLPSEASAGQSQVSCPLSL